MTLNECIDELYVLKEDIENRSVDIEYAIDGLARILPLLDAAFQKTQWQPIKTAPRLGIINVFCKATGITRGKWSIVNNCWELEISLPSFEDRIPIRSWVKSNQEPDLWCYVLRLPPLPQQTKE